MITGLRISIYEFIKLSGAISRAETGIKSHKQVLFGEYNGCSYLTNFSFEKKFEVVWSCNGTHERNYYDFYYMVCTQGRPIILLFWWHSFLFCITTPRCEVFSSKCSRFGRVRGLNISLQTSKHRFWLVTFQAPEARKWCFIHCKHFSMASSICKLLPKLTNCCKSFTKHTLHFSLEE